MNRIDAPVSTAIKLFPEADLHRSGKAGDFAESLRKFVGEVDQLQQGAEQKAEALQAGQPVELHEVMIAAEKADISMRLLMTMRNHVVDAYQEIMRMQI